jgi:hypothetical protein
MPILTVLIPLVFLYICFELVCFWERQRVRDLKKRSEQRKLDEIEEKIS